MKEPKSQIFAEKARTTPTRTTTAHHGRLIDLQLEEVDWADGQKTYEIVKHPGAVAILPFDTHGNVLLVEQWRRPIDRVILELPAGTLEPGEDPATCAVRELQEEIGFKPKELTPLGQYYSAPGFCTEMIHLFIARDLLHDPLVGDDSECIEMVRYTPDEIDTLIKEGKIHDAKLLVAWHLHQQSSAR